MSNAEKINLLIAEVRQMPAAGSVVVFGSVARRDKPPVDLDLVLDARDCGSWQEACEKYQSTIAELLALARRHYGYLDPFVWTQAGLVVRNAEATGWQRANHQKTLVQAIGNDGVPLTNLQLESISAPDEPSMGM